MMFRIVTAAFLLMIIACGAPQPRSELAVKASATELYRTQIEDEVTFQSLAKDLGGLIQGASSIKFLIDQRNPAKPGVYFINGNFKGTCRSPLECSRYHYDFAVQTLRIQDSVASFNNATYFSHQKSFVAGTLNRYQLKDRGVVFAIQLYPQDVASEQEILALSKSIGAMLSKQFVLAFVATGDQQTTSTVQADLDQAGILNLSLNTILGDTNYFPLHQGDAWGYLRLFPKNQEELMPTDIPVFDELPLDLSVVAGTITRAYQDTNSHINLKSKERNTPNMVLRDASAEQLQLKNFIDQPVHLKVTAQGFVIEPSTAKEVNARYQKKIRKRWLSLRWTEYSTLENFDQMCPTDLRQCLDKSAYFGSKAANLGFLKGVFRNKDLPQSAPLSYDPVPVGYGVPLKFYKDFIALAANAPIKAKIDALIQKEKTGLISVAERNTASAEIRQLILNAELKDETLQSIVGMAQTVAPTVKKWKIRSSANAEDIEGFDGAGLHDSYSAKVTTKDNPDHSCILVPDNDPGEVAKMKVEPKSFACAIKGVYASLWNKRAIEERSFARIDHATIAMGLAILPSYDTESPVIANSVVITRVINNPSIFGYALSIQQNNNTVTNPAPGTWSEQTIFAQSSVEEPSSLTTLRFALPVAGGEVLKTNVLPAETNLQMVRITQKVEEAYCRAKGRSYYSGDCNSVAWDSKKSKALDLEMKYLENHEFVLKQVREFSGR